MDDIEDTAGRRTRAFWHRFPNDDAWRLCTLASSIENGFRYQPCCRNCWHSGEIMTPEEVSLGQGRDGLVHLGEIHDVMIDKQSGKTAYAIMSFGGFLGMGEQYHPLPWSTLKYDTRQGGYVIGITVDELKVAPTFGAGETPAWGDRAYETRIHEHYRTAPYWGVAGL